MNWEIRKIETKEVTFEEMELEIQRFKEEGYKEMGIFRSMIVTKLLRFLGFIR